MASILKVGQKWRALVRMKGETKCKTFLTKGEASAWAGDQERDISTTRSGKLKDTGEGVAALIQRYIDEVYPVNRWSPSKGNELRRLQREFQDVALRDLDKAAILASFVEQAKTCSGGGISARLSYLTSVFNHARSLWHIDAPLFAAQEARKALTYGKMIYRSNERDRRVTDAEFDAIHDHIEANARPRTERGGLQDVPVRDFNLVMLVTGMRGCEIAQLRWDDLKDAPKPTIKLRKRKGHTKPSTVPLLKIGKNDAYEIIKRQPRIEGEPRIFPYCVRVFESAFRTAAKKIGIEDLHHHDLRHEGLSRMFEDKRRFTIPQVALVSGHRDWKHLKRYTNLNPTDLFDQ